jgi:hypothetical protein
MTRDVRAAPAGRFFSGPALGAAALYVVAAIVMTWPLARGVARDVPWDLGDSLLNCWILGWNAERALDLMTGDFRGFGRLWHANIFAPEPYALAYSELLFAQTLQILPVYALTKNLVLSYNLLFLSTYVLSGLGTFLFVREVTKSWWAGVLAGLFYAFALNRISQGAQIQVISSQWMPFVLYFLRRYFETWQTRGLLAPAGVVATLTLQNLSNGYYLVWFPTFVLLYAFWEIASRRLALEPKVWRDLALTALATAVLTLPCLYPYYVLRGQGVNTRGIEEAGFYSADVASYATASVGARFWGPRLRLYPRAEGYLFIGLLPAVLAGWSIGSRLRSGMQNARQESPAAPDAFALARRIAVVSLLVIGALHFAGLAIVLLGAGGRHAIGPIGFKITDPLRPLLIALACGIGVLMLSPTLRRSLGGPRRSLVGWAAAAAFLAFWMSLGPEPRVFGQPLRHAASLSIYRLFFEYVPGFDALRVPARLSMLVALFVAILAGLGLPALIDRFRRPWLPATTVALAFLAEAWFVPMTLNRAIEAPRGTSKPPSRVAAVPADLPLNRFLRTLPEDAIVIEYPFGSMTWDLHHEYNSTGHGRRLVNGYSGSLPQPVAARYGLFANVPERGDEAWVTLLAIGTTHAVVYADAFLDGRRETLPAWFDKQGARRVATIDGAIVFELPRHR